MTFEHSGGYCETISDDTKTSKILRMLKDGCVHGGKLFACKMEMQKEKFSMEFLEKCDWYPTPWFVARIYGTMEDLNKIAENLPRHRV